MHLEVLWGRPLLYKITSLNLSVYLAIPFPLWLVCLFVFLLQDLPSEPDSPSITVSHHQTEFATQFKFSCIDHKCTIVPNFSNSHCMVPDWALQYKSDQRKTKKGMLRRQKEKFQKYRWFTCSLSPLSSPQSSAR